jgi:hypothetical protein
MIWRYIGGSLSVQNSPPAQIPVQDLLVYLNQYVNSVPHHLCGFFREKKQCLLKENPENALNWLPSVPSLDVYESY